VPFAKGFFNALHKTAINITEMLVGYNPTHKYLEGKIFGELSKCTFY